MSEPEPLSPGSLPPELKGFEASLAALVPSASAVNRDRLMFEAGRASRGSARLPWTVAALSFGSLCTLVVMTFVTAAEHFGPSDGAVTPLIDRDESRSVAEASPVEPTSYAHLRRFIADADLAAFDADAAHRVGAQAADRNSLLRELLN